MNGGNPRIVSNERGPYYLPKEGEELMTPLGHIEQVEHTFGYWDQDYAIMNDQQLAICESTCGARTIGWPLGHKNGLGKNMFSINELSKVALERCDNARCAVKIMGKLASEHGFYSEDSGEIDNPGFADSAESLGITDKYGEAWIFHVLTGLDGEGAIWAAQRVPDSDVAALANGFIIRTMDLNDPDNYLASDNVISAAIKMGWYNAETDGDFDFYHVWGFDTVGPVMPYYLGRRIWRVYDLIAPSLKLNPYLGSFPNTPTYPFSVTPDEKITKFTIMDIFRDHYEGTQFDMTKGVAAGPFGNPNRYDGNPDKVVGGWERQISMYRTAFSFVANPRPYVPDELGVLYYAHDAPHGSVYVPFYVGATEAPPSYLVGKQSHFDRTINSAWWAFNFVNNWIQLRWNVMIVDVRAEISRLATMANTAQPELEKQAQALYPNVDAVRALLTEKSIQYQEYVTESWWKLADTLVTKYSNGYRVDGEGSGELTPLGYPGEWLKTTEFVDFPAGPNNTKWDWVEPAHWPNDVFWDPTYSTTPGAAVEANAQTTVSATSTPIAVKADVGSAVIFNFLSHMLVFIVGMGVPVSVFFVLHLNGAICLKSVAAGCPSDLKAIITRGRGYEPIENSY